MKKRYVYFVSYAHPTGYGNFEIASFAPYTEYHQIETARRAITEASFKNMPHGVTILNYILLREEEIGE